jgi:hypothetical protein
LKTCSSLGWLPRWKQGQRKARCRWHFALKRRAKTPLFVSAFSCRWTTPCPPVLTIGYGDRKKQNARPIARKPFNDKTVEIVSRYSVWRFMLSDLHVLPMPIRGMDSLSAFGCPQNASAHFCICAAFATQKIPCDKTRFLHGDSAVFATVLTGIVNWNVAACARRIALEPVSASRNISKPKKQFARGFHRLDEPSPHVGASLGHSS